MNEKKLKFPLAPVFFLLAVVINVLPMIPVMMPVLQMGFRLNFWSGMPLLIWILLAVVLIMKRRDILLIGATALGAVFTLVRMLAFFSISNVFPFLAYLVLTAIALDVCEQNVLKIDLSSVVGWCKKLWFVPGILLALTLPGTFSMILKGASSGYVFVTLLKAICEMIALFLLGRWLANPAYEGAPAASGTTTAGATAEGSADEAYCGLGKHIVLLLFTFGIWNLIWIYRTTKFGNRAPGAQLYKPVNKLLLCMFVPFYSIYWYYKHGQRLDAMSKEKGLNHSDMATLCLILGIFIPIVACILMQDRINAICTAKTPAAPVQTEGVADELKKYKELLDMGAITQEEYEAKKKELLRM